ncbi:MAG: hypothetical protein GX639_18225 [Fibrobacter sp.]|nr:hypothetical protein [Fibrobacter sp.]
MDNTELLWIKKLFEENSFDWVYGYTLPKKPCLSDKYKKRYIVKAGDTLESIANDIVGNKENLYADISPKFKNYQKSSNNEPWKFFAEYNYGTSVQAKINWVCCESHGFNENSNISPDKKTYKFNGGEVLYYPIRQPILSGTEKIGIVTTDVPGYILFPSFATPSIVQSGGKISLMILSKEALTPSMVNSHLKIVSWSDPDGESVCKIKDISFNDPEGYKGYKKSLTGRPTTAGISCSTVEISETIIDKEAGNAFVPDIELISSLKKIGLSTLNKVCIDLCYLNDIADGFYNLFWINLGQELEDKILQQRLVDENILGKRIQKHSNGYYYSWEVEENSFYLENISESLPIAGYHPLLITNKEYCNYAHLGDLHCVSRLSLLKLSKAKVIDHDNIDTIGSLINDYVSTVKNLLFQKELEDVDAFLISGDLIDFMYNFYPVQMIEEREKLRREGKNEDADRLAFDNYYNTPGKIWDAVGVNNRDDTREKYELGVDLVTLYGIILELYQKVNKPVFIVTGNHDAYEYPYGVSPRVLFGQIKANAGIPADMNLTFHEAILVYGKYFDAVINTGNFSPKMMSIVYKLFTPMTDYVISGKKWSMIGFGWGSSEVIQDMIPRGQGKWGGFLGHLPTASGSLTQKQVELMNFVVNLNKKITLFSHFTILSFEQSISSGGNPSGKLTSFAEFNKRNAGTFELQRREILKYIVDDQKIEIALSGHAHRRGLYAISTIGKDVIEQMFSFSEIDKVKNSTKIVVSDSSGPISKYNEKGEFANNGLCTPSITKVIYNDNGEVAALEKISSTNANAKPRLAVALDYWYIIGEKNFFESFRSKEYTERELKNLSKIEFEIELTEDFWNLEIICEKIVIFAQGLNGCDEYQLMIQGKPLQVLINSSKKKYFYINADLAYNEKNIRLFLKQIKKNLGEEMSCMYLSFIYNSNAARIKDEYNCKSPYNFKAQVSWKISGFFTGKSFIAFERDNACKEIPDFKAKSKHNPKIY